MLLMTIALGHHPLYMGKSHEMGEQMCHALVCCFGHLLSLLGEDLWVSVY